jgi:hypothetical protein
MYAAILILSVICAEALGAGSIASPGSEPDEFAAFSREVLSILNVSTSSGQVLSILNESIAGPLPSDVTQGSPGNLRGRLSEPLKLNTSNVSEPLWPTPSRRLTAGLSSIDRISTDLISNQVTQALIAKAAYQGFADLFDLIKAGASPREIAGHTFVTVGTLISTGAAGVYPLAGAAISVFTSMIGGLIGGSNSNPQQALYEMIIKQVQLMINRNNLAIKLRSVQNRLLAIADELSWVPDVLAETPLATQIAWMLTVQHSLELSWRDVFGDCVQDGASAACRDWQEAGTVDLVVRFAGMHLILLGNMATGNSSTVTMGALLERRMDVVGRRYSPLMFSSFHAYKDHRLAAISSFKGEGAGGLGSPGSRRRTTGNCPVNDYDHYWLKVTDSLDENNPTVYWYSECVQNYIGYHFDFWSSAPGILVIKASEAARDGHIAAIQSSLADTLDQIEILSRPFPPTPIAPAICDVTGRKGSQSTCNTYLQACKGTVGLGKGRNGCEVFMHGWAQRDNFCESCSPTTRAFGCHDTNECNSFCDDIYRTSQDDVTECRAGCDIMLSSGSRFGASVATWCRGRP